MEKKSYPWFPGNARHDRGYTLEEALVAVGPGWGELVEEAWRLVDETGGGVVQVKEKWFGLRIYFRVPPEHEERVRERVYAIEAMSFDTPEGKREWSEVMAYQEQIPWEEPEGLPEWWSGTFL